MKPKSQVVKRLDSLEETIMGASASAFFSVKKTDNTESAKSDRVTEVAEGNDEA